MSRTAMARKGPARVSDGAPLAADFTLEESKALQSQRESANGRDGGVKEVSSKQYGIGGRYFDRFIEYAQWNTAEALIVLNPDDSVKDGTMRRYFKWLDEHAGMTFDFQELH